MLWVAIGLITFRDFCLSFLCLIGTIEIMLNGSLTDSELYYLPGSILRVLIKGVTVRKLLPSHKK